jgi:membrane protease YdiL (CAAX protease family)
MLLVVIVLFLSVFKEQVINVERINALLNKWNLKSINPVLFLLLTILANSVLEEIYWRGYIFHKFKKKTKVVNVIVLTSLFYCSYHFITTINLFSLKYSLLFTAIIFGISIFWGYMRNRFKSIYIPIVSHLFADLGIMLIYIKHFS